VAEDTFYIGLTMAGAISAGAYTGGVLDVLFAALDRHNARFEAGRNGGWQGEFARHPRHKVALRVISGTSAGGVSAGLAVAGLVGAHSGEDAPGAPQIGAKGNGSFTSEAGYSYQYSYILKPLHHVWVEALDLFRNHGGAEQGFLTTGDLRERPVDSALNSEHIDDAARAALGGITPKGKPFRFLTEHLDLFLTTTNLQGVPYEVGFIAGGHEAQHTHAMSQHSIVRHFRVSGLGTEPHNSPWLEAWQDAGIPLPMRQGEVIDFDRPGTPWARFKAAALATGAFPVGLAARVIDAEASDFGIPGESQAITGGAWPINLKPGLTPDTRPKPKLVTEGGAAVGPKHPVHYVAVDGGVANNEPFELARYTLRRHCEPEDQIKPGDKFLESNPRDAETADCAVLMIDPFPEGPTYSAITADEARLLAGILPAVRKLIPALINQARFKPGELIEATDTRVFSRYLLSPSRRLREDEAEKLRARGAAVREEDLEPRRGAAAIASGSFGGFGGFFDRAFRAHDYMLGQRNARSFLQNYFNLHPENPVLGLKTDEERAQAALPWPDGPIDRRVPIVQPGADFFPDAPDLPQWPRIGQAQLDPILDRAQDRIHKLGRKLLTDLQLSWILQQALGLVWALPSAGAGKRIAAALRGKVLHELIRRDQHHEFRELKPNVRFTAWQRAVLAALATAGDAPIPVRLPEAERRAARDKKAEPRDLVAALEALPTNERPTGAELRAFLDDPALKNRVWRAPGRDREGALFALEGLRPSQAWAWWSATTDRVAGLFGR
jgi:hypothetical protein